MAKTPLGYIRTRLSRNRKIKFTRHFLEERLPERPLLSEQEIVLHLRNPLELKKAEYQPDAYAGEKYALLFHKSARYDLKIVISFTGERLNVVTAHIVKKRFGDIHGRKD